VANLWPSRSATQDAAFPASFSTARTVLMQSNSVSTLHFLSAVTDLAQNMVPNTDYWYAPTAEWLIPRGDSVRCLFSDTQEGGTPPLVALSGRKVLG
jgi:hypothetical protein